MMKTVKIMVIVSLMISLMVILYPTMSVFAADIKEANSVETSEEEIHTLKDYLFSYCEQADRDAMAMKDFKIWMMDSERFDESWTLPDDFSEETLESLFDIPVERLDNRYHVTAEQRYYILLTSRDQKYYIPVFITSEGEMGIGRYVDHDALNDYEYLVKDMEGFLAKYHEICQPGKNGYSLSLYQDQTVHVHEETLRGNFDVDNQNAKPGESVTITIVPYAYSILNHLLVLDVDGNSLELTDLGNNTFRFIQPSSGCSRVLIFYRPHRSTDAVVYYGDVNNRDSWYYDAVNYVSKKQYFQGDGFHFNPDSLMTRAMFVTVLSRMAGIDPSQSIDTNYQDVPADAWYAPAVQWATEHGIVNGIGENRFDPDGNITREQMVSVLYSYTMEITEDEWDDDFEKYFLFPDTNQVSEWAFKPMIWATNLGLIHGTDRGLEPQSNATRAQIAQMFLNYDVVLDSPSLPENLLKQLRERPFFQETACVENDRFIVLSGYFQREPQEQQMDVQIIYKDGEYLVYETYDMSAVAGKEFYSVTQLEIRTGYDEYIYITGNSKDTGETVTKALNAYSRRFFSSADPRIQLPEDVESVS